MKTTTFKGMLVDMSCAASTAASPTDSGAATAPQPANSANRTAADSGAKCQVTSSSTQLGIKLDDGRTVHFDLVGNQRAQDALKNDKNWSKDLSANKPIHAKVTGALDGDKLIVSEIH
jgi:hypothetical protein